MTQHPTATATRPRTATATAVRTRRPRLWNVVLLDDDDHTYEYVIEMMMTVFKLPAERGFEIAKRVDEDGRAVCQTTHREFAELRVDQIRGFGADVRMQASAGPMSAILEPADLGGDDDED